MKLITYCNPNSDLAPSPEAVRLSQMDAEEGGFYGCAGDDDLADANANEADDYRDEGPQDPHLDCQWEDQQEMGMMDDF